MASSSANFRVSFGSVVRGFHIYKFIWTPVVNDEHSVQQERGNAEDQYAVAIINNDLIVGHVPRELSQIFWFFIERGGEISCRIMGRRQRSPLLQGGLEIPCIYTLRGKKQFESKLRQLLKSMDIELLQLGQDHDKSTYH